MGAPEQERVWVSLSVEGAQLLEDAHRFVSEDTDLPWDDEELEAYQDALQDLRQALSQHQQD